MLLLAASSCRSSCGDATPTAAPAASAAPGAGACGPLLEQNRRKLQAVPLAALPDQGLRLDQACFPTKLGAWGLRLVSWRLDADEGVPSAHGQVEVVHFIGAAEATWPPASARTTAGIAIETGLDQVMLHRPELTDVDGDGEAEFFFSFGRLIHEGGRHEEGHLLTARDGVVKEYPGLPPHVEDIEDVDRDGRMDFLYYPHEQQREHPCSGFGYVWRGPELVAHGLPGGLFSLDDEVARNHAKKACPAPPGKPSPPAAPASGEDEPAPELCARLWGQSEAEALALLRSICRPMKSEGDSCQPGPGECASIAEREQAIRQAPTLLLR